MDTGLVYLHMKGALGVAGYYLGELASPGRASISWTSKTQEVTTSERGGGHGVTQTLRSGTWWAEGLVCLLLAVVILEPTPFTSVA